MSELQDAIEQIQILAKGLSGMRSAPKYPPESENEFPFAVTYAFTSSWQGHGSQTQKRGLHTVITEIHCKRAPGLARAVQQAMPYDELFADALLEDVLLNETVTSLGHGEGRDPIRATFGALEWGDEAKVVPTIGWRFEIDVKIVSSID